MKSKPQRPWSLYCSTVAVRRILAVVVVVAAAVGRIRLRLRDSTRCRLCHWSFLRAIRRFRPFRPVPALDERAFGNVF